MTKEELRIECTRFFKCKTINDSYDLIDIYTEFLFNAVKNHHDEPVYKHSDADAKMVLQMMMTKTLHLKSIVKGISYKAKDGSTLNNIIDPTIVASLVRNIYETVAMFNLIYRHTKTEDEKNIVYLLWVHAGLKYRQRFEDVITTEENKEKYENEKAQLDKIVQEIESIELYKNLDEKNQNKIKTKLKEKDYLLELNGKEVNFLHWHELVDKMGIKEGLLGNIYTYFSLYSHPSNVSVFQFADMFKKGDESFLELTNFNLKLAFFLFSIFIADYINLFPNVLETFNSLDIRDQIVINFYNTVARNESFSINDSAKAVE
jgi:hypothetical protein